MERGLILLVAALMFFVAPGIQGTSHLSFDNDGEVNITRDGCGVSKLCVETPDDCHPVGNNTCLFASVRASAPMAPLGTDLSVELSGNSQGYVAVGITTNLSTGFSLLFACAQNANETFFRTLTRNNSNNQLSAAETRVRNITVVATDGVVRCKFVVSNVNATNTRASEATTFSVLLGTGNVTGGTLDTLRVALTTEPLDLADPTSNLATTVAPTNMTMTTTSGASSVLHPQALLLLSVLTLPVTLRV